MTLYIASGIAGGLFGLVFCALADHFLYARPLARDAARRLDRRNRP